MKRATVLLISVSLLAACARPVERPAAPAPEPARARAALATLHVVNLTAERLTVVYRITGRGSSEVTIGTVLPRSYAELAPVPAGEPLVLVARTAAGTELILPARTFPMDGAWTWQIDAGSRFTPPDGAG